MNQSQKKVAIGAGSGVVTMIVLLHVFYFFLPTIHGVMSLPERLAFTLQMNLFALIPFFVMIIFIGNGRFLSDAIDPTKHLESNAMEINGRVADNTLQQTFVFLVGTLALTRSLDTESMKLIVALTIVFILARVVFWIGYRIDPLYRAPGMAATSYMNLGIIIYAIVQFIG